MLSDDEARRLLHRAGETVAVDPAPPLAETPGRRPVWPVLAAAVAVVAIAVTAVVVGTRATEDDPVQPAPPAPETVAFALPSVLGYEPGDATTLLRAEGLTIRLESQPGCPPINVQRTEPAAGSVVRPGDEVLVIVSDGQGFCASEDPDPATDSDPAPNPGPAFRDFAQGGEVPPIADEVDLYLGNAFTGFVPEKSAEDRKAWATCTELGEYAGRACPLSPLEVLEQHAQVDYVDRPRGTCMQTYGPIPPDLRALDRTVIVPAEGSVDSCIDDFAVQLFANDDGQLVAVSLLLGEP